MADQDLAALTKYVEDHVGKLFYTDLEKNLSNIVATITEYAGNVLALVFPKSLLIILDMVEKYLKSRSYHLSVSERNFILGAIHNFHEIAAGQMKIGVPPTIVPLEEETPAYSGPLKTSKKFSLARLFRKKDKKVVNNIDETPAEVPETQVQTN